MSDQYYSRRAEKELLMARAATDPAAVRAHYELANRYLDRCCHADDEARPDDEPAPA